MKGDLLLEKQIEERACRWALANGWDIAMKFQSPGHRSVPDRIFVRQGKVVLIEFKRKDGKLTPGQEREIERWRNAGIQVEICYSVEEAKRVLKEASNEA